MIEINEQNFPYKWDISISNKKLRKAIYEAYKGKCFYSGRPLTLENMRIDHVIPRSKGGPDNIYNYVLCEEEINGIKSAKLDWTTCLPILGIIKINFVAKVIKFLTATPDVVRSSKPREKRKKSRSIEKNKSQEEENFSVSLGFLEYPFFFPSRKLEGKKISEITEYKTMDGFHIQSPLGLPTYFDKKLLYLFMSKAPCFTVPESIDSEFTFNSYYEILKKVGLNTHNGKNVDRIKNCIKKWELIRVSVEGFGGTFGVLQIKEMSESYRGQDKHLILSFNKDFIHFVRGVRPTLKMDIVLFKKFKIPFAARLFEILYKNLWFDGKQYQIHIEKLFIQMGDDFRHLNDGVFKINKALSELKELIPEAHSISFTPTEYLMVFSIYRN